MEIKKYGTNISVDTNADQRTFDVFCDGSRWCAGRWSAECGSPSGPCCRGRRQSLWAHTRPGSRSPPPSEGPRNLRVEEIFFIFFFLGILFLPGNGGIFFFFFFFFWGIRNLRMGGIIFSVLLSFYYYPFIISYIIIIILLYLFIIYFLLLSFYYILYYYPFFYISLVSLSFK